MKLNYYILTVRRRFHLGSVVMQQPHEENPLLEKSFSLPNADGQAMAAKWYLPARVASSEALFDKAVLFIHGGGFCIGDLQTHDEYCRKMVEVLGLPTVAIDYRLAPEYSAPIALNDCLAAYRWLHSSAESPVQGKALMVCGDSAGACLATLTAQAVSKEGTIPAPFAQLLWYPVTDIQDERYPSREQYGEKLTLTQADFDAFATLFLENSTEISDPIAWAPMQADVRGNPPAFVITAGLDMLHDEGVAYAKKLRDADVAVQTRNLAGAPHGFLHLLSVHEETGQFVHQALQACCQWLIDGMPPDKVL